MGTHIDIWDPGDPPRPLSEWLERHDPELAPDVALGTDLRRAPTPRIREFADRLVPEFAAAGVDLAEHLPEMASGDGLTWFFVGDSVSVGKVLGPRAVDVLKICSQVAREVGAVPFMGNEEVPIDGYDLVYPDAPPRPEYRTRTFYVTLPQIAAFGSDGVRRRAGWPSVRAAPTDPALREFLDRLTERLADLRVVPGSGWDGSIGAFAGDHTWGEYRNYTHRPRDSRHDWSVVSIHLGGGMLEVSTDPVDTLGDEIEGAVRAAAGDLPVVEAVPTTRGVMLGVYLAPAGVIEGSDADALLQFVGDASPVTPAVRRLAAQVEGALTGLGLSSRGPSEAPMEAALEVIYDIETPFCGYVAAVEASGEVLRVTATDAEDHFVADVMAAVTSLCPPGWAFTYDSPEDAAFFLDGRFATPRRDTPDGIEPT